MIGKKGVPTPERAERGSADFGDWAVLIRELSGHDYDKAQLVLCWPIREALLAYVDRLRQQALDSYRHELLVWALLAPHQKKPPEPPKPPTA